MAVHRERRQLQSRDPALGPRVQRLHIVGRKLQPHRVVEEDGGFVGREAKVAGTQLGDLVPRS